MARKYKLTTSSGYTIVLADDDPDYLEATRLLLESEGHDVLCAKNGFEALAVVQGRQAHLLLLDYFMPGMTGEEVVVKLRQFNPNIQIILQTGYANERPPREMLRRLDIQGYYDKSEGPDRLLLWTDAGLKAASAVQRLYKSRQGLRFLLDVMPGMHKIQPIADLAEGILRQFAGLLRAGDIFLTARPEGETVRPPPGEAESFIALVEDESELVTLAGTGPFAPGQELGEALLPEELAAVTAALELGEPDFTLAWTIIPLHAGEVTAGVIFLRLAAVPPYEVELLKIFANQATIAIKNAQLYEMATLDPLTGVYARGFFKQWILREVRAAFRSKQPLSMLLLDLDDLKGINDTAGHLVGDQALVVMGKVLRQVTRETDVVARYGGDEFVVILPQTSADDAERIGLRVLQHLEDKTVLAPPGPKPLRTSAGLSVLPSHAFSFSDVPHPFPPKYFQDVAQELIRQADTALYQAKKQGRGRLCLGSPAVWAPMR
jgi:two-component system, cell cycle response regulator